MNDVHFLEGNKHVATAPKRPNDEKIQKVMKTKSEMMRERVLAGARDLMSEEGIEAVQIRAVAAKANCSVGSIYKHFADNDDLLVAVNSATLDDLHTHMKSCANADADPLAQLKVLARAYLSFAASRENSWRGLFQHHLPQGRGIPPEHLDRNIKLLELISEPLKALNPTLEGQALSSRTRTCFAAMHGLVSIALEGRFVALTGSDLEGEMDFVVERLCS